MGPVDSTAGGGDEVNIVEKGKNYGWPVIHPRDGCRDGITASRIHAGLRPAVDVLSRRGVSAVRGNYFLVAWRARA